MQSVKLDDNSMQQYLRDGYLILETSIDQDFHKMLFGKVKEVFETEGNPGNNLLPRLPEIRKIFQDQAVSGSLSSILGEDYFMEPHRHCHYNAPGSKDQELHKDSFTRRRHRTRRLLAFYYPQDTTEDMGPTSVVPGSHYYNTLAGAMEDSQEKAVTVKAGTVVIANYDIWHRGTANTSKHPRYMMKFLFSRMSEPVAPTWNMTSVKFADAPKTNRAMHQSMWAWHNGTETLSKPIESVSQLANTVLSDSEPASIDAAYQMGSSQYPSIAELVELLKGPSGSYWWEQRTLATEGLGITSPSVNASYGLCAAGALAVPALINLADDDRWWLRATVSEILGDIGLPASESIPMLIKLAKDQCTSVRTEAVHALGTVAQRGSLAVPSLANALTDHASSVRQEASMALARTGPKAERAVPSLVSALEDTDRYVRGNSAHALYRIDSPQSKNALLEYLLPSRWCDITTKNNTY